MRVLVQMKSTAKVRFEHVDVQNESRICPPDAPPAQGLPEKIIVIGPVDRDLPPGYRVTFLQDRCVSSKKMPQHHEFFSRSFRGIVRKTHQLISLVFGNKLSLSLENCS